MNATKTGYYEFIILMSLLSALMALSIDATLPAMGTIEDQLSNTHHENIQWVISLLFAGMALGQVLFGPLSDTLGRRLVIFIGLGIFMAGSLLSYMSQSLDMMLLGRFLQGTGAASARIVSMALIRDRFEGREMAQVLSFIMSVFILVPTLAPAVGLGVMNLWSWREIFGMFALIAFIALVWFALRQNETLKIKHTFSLHATVSTVKQMCLNITTIGYTLVLGVVYGAFVAYLELAQPIFCDVYNSGNMFVFYFAIFALSLGVASFTNAKLVRRMGMRKLSYLSLRYMSVTSLLFLPVTIVYDGIPPFTLFVVYGMATLFFQGLLMGNLNAMAMEPLGKAAGLGASFVGSVSTFIAVFFGIVIGHYFDTNITPVVTGYALLSTLALLLFIRIKNKPVTLL